MSVRYRVYSEIQSIYVIGVREMKRGWAEETFKEIMVEPFLKSMKDIKSDSSISMNPTKNNIMKNTLKSNKV